MAPLVAAQQEETLKVVVEVAEEVEALEVVVEHQVAEEEVQVLALEDEVRRTADNENA